MEWSLGLLFGLIVLVIFLFKKCEEFKGGRGGFRMGRGRRNRKFDIVDVVFIVLIIYYLFLNR
jgi:hypothetical protein